MLCSSTSAPRRCASGISSSGGHPGVWPGGVVRTPAAPDDPRRALYTAKPHISGMFLVPGFVCLGSNRSKQSLSAHPDGKRILGFSSFARIKRMYVNKNVYLCLVVLPVFICNALQWVALHHPHVWPKLCPAVGATEGNVGGMFPQVLQAVHTHAVSAREQLRIFEDVLAHRARQHLLQLLLHSFFNQFRSALLLHLKTLFLCLRIQLQHDWFVKFSKPSALIPWA